MPLNTTSFMKIGAPKDILKYTNEVSFVFYIFLNPVRIKYDKDDVDEN